MQGLTAVNTGDDTKVNTEAGSARWARPLNGPIYRPLEGLLRPLTKNAIPGLAALRC